jgi:transposase-like protein
VFAVIAIVCQHENRRTNGVTKSGAARFRCKDCGKSWTEATAILGGLRMGVDRAVQIIELLCEGMSVRAAERITGTCKASILDLLCHVGERCESYMQENIREVFVGDVQVDEIWQYIYCKKATAKQNRIVGGCGDSYCFTAIDRTSKLLITWHKGDREDAHEGDLRVVGY